jgi:predicted amidohydrolase YtcJ
MTVLVRAGTVWLGERPRPRRDAWLLVEDGRIREAGHGPAPAADREVDLGQHHVLPGFTDAHSHLTAAAWLPVAGDGAGWRSRHDALRAVRQAASAAGEGQPWLLFARFDEHDWDDPGLPSVDDLDEAAGGRPVLLAHLSLHRGVVSSAALAAIADRATDPDLDRDRRGRPTGVIWERGLGRALFAASRSLAELHDPVTRLAEEAARHLAVGITRVHDPGVPVPTAVHLEAAAARTPLRLSWAAVSPTGLLDPLRVGDEHDGPAPTQVKAFLDGAERCAISVPAAALPGMTLAPVRASARRRSLAPLREAAGRRLQVRAGQVVLDERQWSDAELCRWLEAHLAVGRRVRIHALGNLAVRQAARALVEVGAPAGAASIEHAMFLGPQDVEAIAGAGAIASLQPGFLPHYARQVADAGVGRHLRVKPLRSLIAAGVPIAISSDHPCGPLDPLHNLRRAVDRRTRLGRLQPEEAIDAVTAIEAATAGGARAIGLPVRAATLVPGAPADLAVCDGDPFDPATRVVQTWVEGAVAHDGGRPAPR